MENFIFCAVKVYDLPGNCFSNDFMSIDADVFDGGSSFNEVDGGKSFSSVDVEGGTTTTLLVVSEIDIEIKLL